MTKMISKFHVLIQSKAVWIVFVGLVVTSFILLPVAANFSSRSDRLANAPGSLNGKPVPREEYENARTQTYMSLVMMSLMYGQEFEFDEDVRKYVVDEAWKRLITLRKAEELGFEAFESEVAAYIRSFPLFSQEGGFNPDIYTVFKQQFLPARGFSGDDFERYAAEEVLIRKTQSMISDLALISPVKIDRSLDLLDAEFKLEYVVIDRDMVANDVATSEADARAVYENDPDTFVRPGQIDLKYVYFDYDDFADRVDQPTEEMIADYYNSNLDDYLIESPTDTNALAAAEKDDVEDETLYAPLDEVEDGIVARLKRDQARSLAVDRANAMVFELPPDRDGKARSFEDVAEEFDVDVRDVEPFIVGGEPALDDGVAVVAREAEQLRPNPDEYFSDAVPADEGVYILALEERKPPFVPPFEVVKDEALELARERNIEKALDERAEELRSSFEADLNGDADFAELAAAKGLEPQSTDEFTLQDASETLPEDIAVSTLSEQVAFLNQGEISEPIDVAGGRLLAYVAQRKPGGEQSPEEMRGMVYRTLRNETVSRLYDRWRENLLAEADFKDLTGEEQSEEEE